MGSDPDYADSELHAMPIHNQDPHDDPNHQEDEDHDDNPIREGESGAARRAEGACDEPIDVEENRDGDEEGNRSVDNLFGVMLE